MTNAIHDLDEFISANFDSRQEAVAQLAASPGIGSLQAIHDYRVGIREAQGELLTKLESHSRAPLRSEQRRWDSLDAQFEEAGELMDDALTERERIEADREHRENQRKRFNHVLGGSKMEKNEQDTELMAWARGETGGYHFDVDLSQLERMDLGKGATAGGTTVPLGFVQGFFQHLIAAAGVRRTNATVYTTAGGEPLVAPKSTADPTAAIISEAGAITPDTAMTFGGPTLGAFKYAIIELVSRELVEDTSIDLAGVLARLLGRGIGTANGAHLVTGTGSGQPQGVLNSPVDGVVGTWAQLVAAATGFDILVDLYMSVWAPYRQDGFWLMADGTLAAIRKLKDTNNNPIIVANPAGPMAETLFGRPIVTDPTVPTGAGAASKILFGDFSSYYAIRDVQGLRLERSDDYKFANDQVAYRAILRTDAKQVLNDTSNSACKVFRATA
jgi:HK97 family phage major capsid protein